MDKLIEQLNAIADASPENEWFTGPTARRSAKLLSECRTAMQSLIDGDPDLAPSELIEKHREWFRELMA